MKEKKKETISKNPTPPQLLSRESVIVKSLVIPTNTNGNTSRNINSPKSFSIASLQQYTNSFSQENLIGRGVLGPVYKAQIPNGKVIFSFFFIDKLLSELLMFKNLLRK